MNETEIREACRETFSEILEIEPTGIGDDADFFADLDGDSLQKLELIVAVERRFGMQLSDSDARHLNTLRRVTEAVMEAGARASTGSP